MRWLGLLLILCSTARADVEGLTLLDQIQEEGLFLPSLSVPIMGDNGAVYWNARIDYELGGNVLKNESGNLLSDARTVTEPGDFPLLGQPSDARGPVVLMGGTYFEPAPGSGFYQTGAIYLYPGLTRLVYFGSTFPGFTSDVVGRRSRGRGFSISTTPSCSRCGAPPPSRTSSTRSAARRVARSPSS